MGTLRSNQAWGTSSSASAVTWSLPIAPLVSAAPSSPDRTAGTSSSAPERRMQQVLRVLQTLRSRE